MTVHLTKQFLTFVIAHTSKSVLFRSFRDFWVGNSFIVKCHMTLKQPKEVCAAGQTNSSYVF